MSKRWWTLIAMSLATFMTYLDNNVVNVAIPTIQRDLHLTFSGLEWVVSSYLLVIAGLLLAGGRAADVFGRKRVFLIGLTIFTLSSLSAGLAGSAGLLIASRAVQGLGAAMLMPATLAIVQATFTEPGERTRAIGIWGAVGALALGFGPVIGGVISEHIRWGWIFLINVPIGIVTFAIALAVAGESHGNTASRRLDWPGLAASSAALFALTYALIDGQDRGWTSAPILAAFAAAAVCFTGFLVIEARSEHPMVPLSMFRYREFTGGNGTMMGWSFGVLGIYIFTSVYLQTILRFSPVKAGLSFVPMALCIALSAGLAPQVVRLLGRNRTVSLGVFIMVVGLCLFAMLGDHASFASLMPGFVVFGLGGGLMTVPLTEAVLVATSPERGGVASALLNESREVGGLLGITVIGAVLRSVQSGSLRGGANEATAFLDGYHAGVFLAIGVLAVCVVVSFVTLRPRALPVEALGDAARQPESRSDAPSPARR